MKSKLLKFTLVIVVAIVAVVNVFNAQKPEVLSDVAMANVEALANDENSNDDCKIFSGYSLSLKANGTLQEYTHYGYGRDILNTFDVVRCIADGTGTLFGSSGIYSKMLMNTEIVNCNGFCRQF